MQRNVSPWVAVVVILIVIGAAVFAWFHFTRSPGPSMPPMAGGPPAEGRGEREGSGRPERTGRGARRAALEARTDASPDAAASEAPGGDGSEIPE